MPKSRKTVNLRRRWGGDYRQRSARDWYDYAMLALALAVLLVGVLGRLR